MIDQSGLSAPEMELSHFLRETGALRSLVDVLPDCIAVKDRELRYVFSNRANTQRLGYEEEEQIAGKTDLDIFPESPGRQLMQEDSRVLGGGKPFFSREERIPSLSGEPLWFLTTRIPLRNAAGEITGLVWIGRDISERYRMQERLRRSEACLAAAQEVSQFGSWELDLADLSNVNRNPLYWSDEIFRVFGYEPGEVEVSNETFFNCVHPDDRQLIREAVAKAVAEKGRYSVDHRILHPNGELRWVHEDGQIFLDEEGNPARMVGSSHDITERKSIEEALRRSEANFRGITEHMSDVVWLTDAKGENVLYVSPSFERVYGVPCDRVLSDSEEFFRSIHPDDLKSVRDASSRMAVSRFQLEYRIVRPDGSVRWISDCSFPITNDDGVVDRIGGLAKDITEEKVERQRTMELAASMEHAQDAIIMQRLDGKVTFWNRSAERMYGWNTHEAPNLDLKRALFSDKGAYDKAKEALMVAGEWQGEMLHLSRTGNTLTVDSHWTLLRDEAGAPKALLMINTDVTEKKRLEAQFLRAQRLESIGTLAGGIAHDLNNVLAPILIALPLLGERIQPEDAEGRQIIATLEQTARRGAEMVRQVLTFARGVDGARTPVNLRYLLNDLQRLMRETFPKQISVSSSIRGDLWSVIGDATQLHQVLLNLCVNARDAMPSGGNLRLGAANIYLDANSVGMQPESAPGPHVMITVSDTGSGIPGELIDKIFDPFFTTKEVGKGTGLGLATSLAIVKSHGGFIHVFSEPGKGSTFKIFIPARLNEEQILEEKQPGVLPHGQGEVILLVDDEAHIRIVTQKALERFGYQVITASNGAAAVAEFAMNRDRIAVVITDMMMPVMDGPATARALIQIDPNVKIVGASGLASNGGFAKLADSGVRYILQKPFTAEAILTLLHQILRESS